MTHGSIRLDKISRHLAQHINNVLGDPANPQRELHPLLMQLKTAIETEVGLSDEHKANALLQVAELATAAQAPDEAAMQSLARRPMQSLQAVGSQVVGDLLGAIAAIFAKY